MEHSPLTFFGVLRTLILQPVKWSLVGHLRLGGRLDIFELFQGKTEHLAWSQRDSMKDWENCEDVTEGKFGSESPMVLVTWEGLWEASRP